MIADPIVSPDRAADAYAAALRNAREYREKAHMIDKIAAALDGVQCTKRIVDKVSPLFPDLRVSYYAGSLSNDKYLRLAWADDSFDLRVAHAGVKRVETTELTALADDSRHRADELTAAAAEFYDAVQQYNIAAAYADKMRAKIAPVMSCIDRNF